MHKADLILSGRYYANALQYLPIRELDNVTNALNFDTAECQVVGGCDVYTTKAAGSDKKLYKNIETSLESQYEAVLRLSASLSPPQASEAAAYLNLSRSSPFGPLSQISSRRTFAYLIATMNASHPDHDFSHCLRPTDFRPEKSLRLVMNTLDTTLYNLRPSPASNFLAVPGHWASAVTPSGSSATTGQPWGPRMWRALDKEMTLKDCSIYSYAPNEDPYDDEEGQIWSFSYFFFNKQRKRVCYFYLRGLSIFSNSQISKTPISTTQYMDSEWTEPKDTGATKRARYWLGDRAADSVQTGWGEDDDEDDVVPVDWEDNEPRLLPSEEHEARRLRSLEAGSPDSGRSSIYSRTLRSQSKRSRSRSMVRGLSEEIAESMDM